jgi:hypothetical protein
MGISVNYTPIGALGALAYEAGQSSQRKWLAEYQQRQAEFAARMAMQQAELSARQRADSSARQLQPSFAPRVPQESVQPPIWQQVAANQAIAAQQLASAFPPRTQFAEMMAKRQDEARQQAVRDRELTQQQNFAGQTQAYAGALAAAQQGASLEASRQSQLVGIGASQQAAGQAAQVAKERQEAEQAFSWDTQQAAHQNALEVQQATQVFQEKRDAFLAAQDWLKQAEATAASERGTQFAATNTFLLDRLRREEARTKDEAEKAFEKYKLLKTAELVEKQKASEWDWDRKMQEQRIGGAYNLRKLVNEGDVTAGQYYQQNAAPMPYLPPSTELPAPRRKLSGYGP